MKAILLFWILTAFLFAACDSNDKESNSEERSNAARDSIAESNTAVSEDKVMVYMNQSGFSEYIKTRSPQLEWNAFAVTKYWKEENPLRQAFTPDSGYYDLYGPLLKYSPDSTRFIDLDSYNLDLHKDRSGRLIANPQGPDTEVSLIDLNKNQQTRLVFLGPGSSVEDAGWIDNNNLVLIGYQEDDSLTKANAVIWHFNLADQVTHLYEVSDENWVTSIKGYSRQRLKNALRGSNF